MLLLATLDLQQGRGPEAWVSRPRFHHQFLPDEVQYEPEAFSKEMQDALVQKGHRRKRLERGYGNMQSLFWDTRSGDVSAASDPRGIGRAEVR
jgi:gamma-glutamyltranspeptidase/glutathione hydrolase